MRSRLGKPLSGWMPFGRWAATPPGINDEFLLDEHPCVTDLNSQQKNPMTVAQGIRLTRDKLCRNGSTVRIIGLSGVGKTRFAQALFEQNVCDNALPAANVIYADLGMGLTPTATDLITYLIANDFSAYVVLDNCPPDVHRQLQKQVAMNQAKISLLTIEYDISDDKPEETDVILIEPSSEQTVSRLIQKRFPTLGQLNADKIAEFAGGNARIAIALASRVGADETLTNFSDEELFKRLFNQRKGDDANLLGSAEVLSLVYSFNIYDSEFYDELNSLAEISGIERRVLYRSHVELLNRQLIQQRGNWRAVLPHALANRLARRALQNIPIEEINTVLFKKENLRLFKSCSHRIGYLHDFEPARKLVLSWVASGAPLHDVTMCGEDLLISLEFISPVLPETVLLIIEEASKTSGFCSRNNEHFSKFVGLLLQLAYEDEHFDRACMLILKFAESEKPSENDNSIVNKMKGLFSIYFSGTHASISRRQAFLENLLESCNPRHLEIVNELFSAAFETSFFPSYGDFGFGAHSRDYGWMPKTQEDQQNWYTGFIDLLKPLLETEDKPHRNLAKELLSTHFRGLWSITGCNDILEEITCKYAKGGNWPEIWLSIKQLLSFNEDETNTELHARLALLEQQARPSDPYSEMEAYAFIDTWKHLDAIDGDYTEQSESITEKIVKLGELAASEPDYLRKLAPRLWKKHVDALFYFGRGIALGSVNKLLTFEFLVNLMQGQEFEIPQPILFAGFLQEVYAEKPSLARQVQERILEIKELKPYFVYLLVATPLTPWSVAELLKLARSGEHEACRFEQIIYGRTYVSITDADLSEILSAIIALENGVFSTIEILQMRFLNAKNSRYILIDKLQAIGRKTIIKLLSLQRDELNRKKLPKFDRIVKECILESSPINEISEIIELLCEGIESFRFNNFYLEFLFSALIKNFTSIVLNKVFKDRQNLDERANLLFRYLIDHQGFALNLAPIDHLVKWCSENKSKIIDVASAVRPYTSLDKEIKPFDNPKQVTLSNHIKAILEISENKVELVEVIFSMTWPSGYSGSLADILEVRSKAFAELLKYPAPEVREAAKEKLGLLEKEIRKLKEQEAGEYNSHEQVFE